MRPSRPPNALKMSRRSGPIRPYPALSGPIRPVPACLRSMPHDSSTTLGRPAFAIPRLSLPAALLISLGLIAIAGGIEHAMGRLLFCKCGTFKLWYGGRGGLGVFHDANRTSNYTAVVPSGVASFLDCV